MSEEQRAEARAQGALSNFKSDMHDRMQREGRSDEYIDNFWRSLDLLMRGGLD